MRHLVERSRATDLRLLITVAIFFFPSEKGIAADPDTPQLNSAVEVNIFAGTGKSPVQGTTETKSALNGNKPLPAQEIDLGNPFGIETRGEEIWITSVDDHSIYHGSIKDQTLRRIVGNGSQGYSGDGAAALSAEMNWPHEVRVDDEGNLYIADTRNHAIRMVDHETGVISTLAGNGKEGFAGDDQSAGKAQFKQPHSIALDGDGRLYVADTLNHRLRCIDLNTGVVSTVCGNGKRKLPVDGSPAIECSLFGPRAIVIDDDSIWIALREGNSIWRIDRATEKIHHVAGSGKKGYTGDRGPLLEATFAGPKGLAIDSMGRLLVVDTENHALRIADLQANVVSTRLGGRTADQNVPMDRPHGISFSNAAGTFIADSQNHRVLLIPID